MLRVQNWSGHCRKKFPAVLIFWLSLGTELSSLRFLAQSKTGTKSYTETLAWSQYLFGAHSGKILPTSKGLWVWKNTSLLRNHNHKPIVTKGLYPQGFEVQMYTTCVAGETLIIWHEKHLELVKRLDRNKCKHLLEDTCNYTDIPQLNTTERQAATQNYETCRKQSHRKQQNKKPTKQQQKQQG